MKNLLMLLLVANILYFMWDRFGDQAEEVGIAILDERRLGPKLAIAKTGMPNVSTAVSAVFEAEGATDLAAAVGQQFDLFNALVTAPLEHRECVIDAQAVDFVHA